MSCLWIGGPPAAGKSTVARVIARRWGIRWYNSDACTWAHRDRAVAEGNAAAIRWERLTVRERWSAPPAELLEMSLHRERGPMIVDDVRALPAAPLTIVEGTPVAPGIAGRHSVWLLPTEEVQARRLALRGQPAEVIAWNRLLTQEILTEVADSSVRTMIVDGQPLEDVVAEVERLFGDMLDVGPRAGTAAERGALVRYANEAIVSQHLAYFARPWSTGDPRTTIRSFACECGQPDCMAEVDLAIADLPREPLLAH